MDLHSLCFQAAPGLLHLPTAWASAFPARDLAGQAELSHLGPLMMGKEAAELQRGAGHGTHQRTEQGMLQGKGLQAGNVLH